MLLNALFTLQICGKDLDCANFNRKNVTLLLIIICVVCNVWCENQDITYYFTLKANYGKNAVLGSFLQFCFVIRDYSVRGDMLRNNPMGHPVMGAIGSRRIAVFIGQDPQVLFL